MTAEIRDEAEFRNDILERLAELEFNQNNTQVFDTINVTEKDSALSVLEQTVPESSSDNDHNIGDVSGALLIDIAKHRFCRMSAIGDTQITFDVSTLILSKWTQITLEILQDPTGQHTVTFDDAPFENQVTPQVFKAANRYTTIRFYAYRISDSAVRIFAFEEFQPFPVEFFDSYIQARITNDQVLNLNPNDHLEFNLKIATDNTITVSTGAGQVSGLFSNFKQGHLYQCECHYAIEGVSPSSELTIQFYNLTKGSFFGSQGRSQTTSHTLQDSSLPVTKGFFIADSIGEVIEVRIRGSSGTNKIIAGVGSADPTTYVIIKDCGVAGLENIEGNLIDAPTPTAPDISGPNEGYSGIWHSNSTTNFDIFFLIGNNAAAVENKNTFPMMSSGKVSKLIVRVITDGGGRADFWIRKNFVDDPLGIILAPPGVGIHETADGSLDTATFVKDDLMNLRWRRNNDNGLFILIPFTEFVYNEADGVQHWYSDNENKGGGTLGFWSPRTGGHVNVGGNLEVDFQARMLEGANIRDMVYYGTSPTGSDNTPIMAIHVNDIPVATRTLATGGGNFIQRFTNVSVNVSTDDRVGCAGRCASSSSSLNGRMGWKIEF